MFYLNNLQKNTQSANCINAEKTKPITPDFLKIVSISPTPKEPLFRILLSNTPRVLGGTMRLSCSRGNRLYTLVVEKVSTKNQDFKLILWKTRLAQDFRTIVINCNTEP